MQLTVTYVDSAPADLYAQVPFTLQLLREIPGPDRPDYWIGRLNSPIIWTSDDFGTREITHVIVGTRFVGMAIKPGVSSLAVNIAYITDPSVLDDSQLDFAKCFYAAIGLADDTTGAGSTWHLTGASS